MSTGVSELQKYTAISKYARWVKKLQRRETWVESVDRFRGMMLDRFPHLKQEILWAFEGVEKLELLGSQRALQYAGKPVLQHNARIYNCCSSYCDRLRFFQEAFYLLLCGCGVGFSVQDRHISTLPKFSKKRLSGEALPSKTFVVPDTIEGWADAQGVLLSSYHEQPILGFEEYKDSNVEFIYSSIRPKGAELSSGIGLAPGPEPLCKSIELNRALLNKVVAEGHTRLDSITAFDLTMHIADAAVSGGVRRSATICLFDLHDKKMASAKTGNWRDTNPQRARANISASLKRDEVSWEQFYELFEFTKQFGEPGFFWTDDHGVLPNPCVEISFEPVLKVKNYHRFVAHGYQGPITKSDRGLFCLSGWQFCNLCTINGRTVKSKEDFFERCRKAAFIGTLQASFTSFPYLGLVSELITEGEALLGVSISGMMHHPRLLLDPEVQREGARLVLETNEHYAQRVGVLPCARGTCIKPDGNSASLLGCFPGISMGKLLKGFRLIQANKLEAPYQFFKQKNPQACEPSVWSANNTDDVIRFCTDNEPEALLEDSVSAVEMLGHVRSTFMNWIEAGKVKNRCSQPWLSNNVSNTIRVRDHEWEDVAKYIYSNRECFAGVSLLSWSGDRDYAQAPFTAVYTDEENVKRYGKSTCQMAEVLSAQAPLLFRDLWDAIDLALGLWDRHPTAEQKEWADNVKAYSDDLRQFTYCMKDVSNTKLYKRLKESYVPVDYSEMVEHKNGTKLQGETACSGGACVI